MGETMNQKFHTLSEAKKNAIINASFRVFSENSYKKAPMSEIALEAGISKSLLFHYFTNKKELYLFLYEYVFNLMIQTAEEELLFEETDLFKFFYRGAKCKLAVLRQHEDLYRFAINAYLEKDPTVAEDIRYFNQKGMLLLDDHFTRIGNRSNLKDGVVISQLIKIIYWCAEGLFLQKGNEYKYDLDKLETEFMKMITFYQRHFSKGENVNECYKD